MQHQRADLLVRQSSVLNMPLPRFDAAIFLLRYEIIATRSSKYAVSSSISICCFIIDLSELQVLHVAHASWNSSTLKVVNGLVQNRYSTSISLILLWLIANNQLASISSMQVFFRKIRQFGGRSSHASLISTYQIWIRAIVPCALIVIQDHTQSRRSLHTRCPIVAVYFAASSLGSSFDFGPCSGH